MKKIIITEQQLIRNIIKEDSGESVKWKGKWYSYFNASSSVAPFLILDDGTTIINTEDNTITHETMVLLICYKMLDIKPPFDNTRGKYDYNKMYNEIELGHNRLFNNITNKIVIQGRVFTADDGNYIFCCYEELSEEDALNMMRKVSTKLRIEKEKCFYVGHYDTLTIPLVQIH